MTEASGGKHTEMDLVREIWEEIRYIRQKLDDHIDDEGHTLNSVRKDIAEIRENISTHKTKLGMISAGLSMIVAGLITWIFHFLDISR